MHASTRSTILFALLGALPCVAPAVAADSPAFGETVDVEVVNVEVFVADRTGRAATDLGPEDFQLLVDGEPTQITNFYAATAGVAADMLSPGDTPSSDGDVPARRVGAPQAVDQTLHLLIFVDHQHILPQNRARVLKQLRRFCEESLSPEDVVSVASYDGSLEINCDFLADRAALSTVLSAVEAAAAEEIHQSSEWQGISRDLSMDFQCSNEPEICAARTRNLGEQILQQIRAHAQSSFSQSLASLDALRRLVGTLAGVPGRKAVVHVSDGIGNRPGEALYEVWSKRFGSPVDSYERLVGSFDMLDRFTEVGRLANASRVTFYAIDGESNHRRVAFSPGAQAGSVGRLDLTTQALIDANYGEPLAELARLTGGFRVQASPGLGLELRQIATDIGAYYSLGFSSPPDETPQDHSIVVRVSGKGLSVRHRRGFRSRPAAERASDEVLAAVLYDTPRNPLAVAVDVLGSQLRDDGLLVVSSRVEIPVANLVFVPDDDLFQSNLTFFVSVKTTSGDPRPVQKLPFRLRIPDVSFTEAQAGLAVRELPLVVRPGDQRAVIGVRDDVAGLTSLVMLDLSPWTDQIPGDGAHPASGTAH